jgi:Meiotically up-regulated gene 113
MIYFAQLPTGAIKIGKADDVEARLGQLEKHYRQPLSLLHVMEGGFETERQIHQRFAHLRISHRGGREQFRPGADLMEFIGLPVLVSANPETVESVPRRYAMVRIEAATLERAKLAASLTRAGSVSDYVSALVAKAAEKDISREAKKIVGGGE